MSKAPVALGEQVKTGPGDEPPRMKVGFNYPWAFNKMGLYFGPHQDEPWMDRWLSFFRENLIELRQMGIEVVRIWLLCNGANYGPRPTKTRSYLPPPRLSLDGLRKWLFPDVGYRFEPPISLDQAFIEHMRQMLEIVKASETGIQLIPSLLTFEFFIDHQDVAKDARKRDMFLSTALDPLLSTSKDYRDQILAWEVMNEPSWDTAIFSPPVRGGSVMPWIPLLSQAEMAGFLAAALKRIEAGGFQSTVGHRYFRDFSRFPTGTLRQFHYYGKTVLGDDDHEIPPYSVTQGAFVGEIAPTDGHGRPWPELHGSDRDRRQAAFERLKALARKGYKLTLIWPDLGWSGPPPGSDFDTELRDPIKLSDDAKESIKKFTLGRFKNGVP